MDSKEIIGNAMEEVLDDEFDKYINELPLYADHKFSDRHNRKMRKLIKRQRKPYFKLISTAGRRAACAVIAVVVFSASALSVNAVRDAVFDFIIERLPNHRGVVTAESGTDEDYPDTIEEEYYLSALPEGFEESYYSKTEKFLCISYSKEDCFIYFTQYTKSDFEYHYTNLDDRIYSDGEKYLVITGEDIAEDRDLGIITLYIWNNGRYVFSVESNLDKDTILNLCNSIKVKE